MRTQEEIKRQIDGLLKMKTWLPSHSTFGTPNPCYGIVHFCGLAIKKF